MMTLLSIESVHVGSVSQGGVSALSLDAGGSDGPLLGANISCSGSRLSLVGGPLLAAFAPAFVGEVTIFLCIFKILIVSTRGASHPSHLMTSSAPAARIRSLNNQWAAGTDFDCSLV